MSDLATPILGCGDGPASFNAELTARGGTVISVDPLYSVDPSAIEQRIEQTYSTVIRQLRAERARFVWRQYLSVEALGECRLQAMRRFLFDYRTPCARYVAGSLPRLPFRDRAFKLALVSHLLFLYSEQFSTGFHVAAIRELCRVSNEVRLFPLLDLSGDRSSHLLPVISALHNAGYDASIERVEYEFQKGGHEMLRVRSPPPCGDRADC